MGISSGVTAAVARASGKPILSAMMPHQRSVKSYRLAIRTTRRLDAMTPIWPAANRTICAPIVPGQIWRQYLSWGQAPAKVHVLGFNAKWPIAEHQRPEILDPVA